MESSEIDDDMPNQTWDAAREQMLLLYGASDKGRRASGHDLIEFFRVQSVKCPYRTKLEIEHYFRDFQYIAAPQVKQRRITTTQRDLILSVEFQCPSRSGLSPVFQSPNVRAPILFRSLTL